MASTSFDRLFWEIVVFLYFIFKDRVLSKIFKEAQVKNHPLINLAIAIAALFFNNQLQTDYARYLNLSYIKGAIQLPPFTLLFLLADFISSVGILFLMFFRTRTTFFKSPFARTFMDVFRLIAVYVVFTTVISGLWLIKERKNMNWNYLCFEKQIAIDLAVFYYRNNRLPEKLEEFTSYKINPSNNSALIYTPGSILAITITDQKGNKIVEGYKDINTLNIYKNDPPGFFTSFRILNKSICSGSLKIPPEYDQDPSWLKK